MSTPPNREEEIVDAALELPAHERAAYLDKLCGNDSQLRQLVDALLLAHKKIISSQIVPPRELSTAPIQSDSAPGEAAPQRRAPGVTTMALSVTPIEKPGDHIGRYKLLQQIGEGGGGIVYMAEQVEPVRRHVALKIIKLGMDTRQVIARFEAERQALALMDHPNIAKVHDAGATETGRPYFVMELVRGVKITDYCDQNHLRTEKRLDLFIQVCKAVQHAHQKGIIHRDIKPSNILVTLHDGLPVPKVIDFGIAKATTGQPLTDKTVFTAFEHFIGTPAYMSPEQAEMSGLDIDTRSDIYSLGVLLYELLTSQMPFDPRELAASGFEEMRRIIRTEDPVRPSTRLSHLSAADQTTAAKCRQVDAPKLIQLVRGDLDWIVMKCLEKDRGRRYDTANGLASDIQRYLNNEPIVARPPSNLYRFQKLVRRNKLAFAAAGALAMMLLLGVFGSTWQAIRAMRAEREQSRLRESAQRAQANEARLRLEAETEVARSKQVAQFMKDMLKGVGPGVALGRDTKLLREILDQTTHRLKDLERQPEVEADLRETLGVVYRELSEFTNAANMHSAALAIRRKLHGSESLEVASTLVNLGAVLHPQGKWVEAEASYREALAVQRKSLGDDHAEVAATLNNLGSVLRAERKQDEAEKVLREALAMRRRVFSTENLDVADSLFNLSLELAARRKFEEAEQHQREALAIRRKLLPTDHPDIAQTLAALGKTLALQKKYPEAEASLRDAAAMQRKLFGDKHRDLALTLRSLADVLRDQNNLPEAEAFYRESLAMFSKVYGDEYQDTPLLTKLLDTVQAQGKRAEAVEIARDVLAARKKQAGGESVAVADSLDALAQALSQAGNQAEAEEVSREAIAMRKKPGDDKRAADALGQLASSRRKAGNYAESEELYREVLAMRRKILGIEHPEVASSLTDLARALRSLGRFVEAESLARESIAMLRTQPGNQDRRACAAMHQLGGALLDQGRLGEAEASFREVIALGEKSGLSESRAPGPLTWTYRGLGDVLAQKAQWFEAEAMFRKSSAEFEKFGLSADVADMHCRVAEALLKQGRLAEAQTAYRQAIALFKPMVQEVPSRRHDCWSLAISYEALGSLLKTIGQTQEAERTYRDAQVLWRKLVADFNTEDYRFHLAVNYDTLGHLLGETGRAAESLEALRAAQAIWLKLAADFNLEDRRMHLGYTDDDIGQLLKEAGRFDEAAEVSRQALAVWKKLVSDFNKDDYRDHLCRTFVNLAAVLQTQGRSAEARSLYREIAENGRALELNNLAWLLATSANPAGRDGTNAVIFAEKAVAGTSRTNAGYLDTLAAAYAEAGEFTNAVAVQQEAISLLKTENEQQNYASRLKLYGANSPYRDHGALAELASARLKEGKFSEAESLARECSTLREKQIPDEWRAFNARAMLGGALLGQKKYAEAEPLLLAGYNGMKQREATIPVVGIPHLKEALQRLVQLYEATDRPEQTAEWKQKLEEFDHAKARKQAPSSQQ